MASVFGHGFVGFTLAKVIDSKKIKWLLFAAIFSSVLPDFDVIGFYLGISYLHPLGHRGFTHSILFSIIWAFILMVTWGRNNKLVWFFTIFSSTLSHGLLDAMTSGGKGVGFFIPFDNDRYFLPFRGIKVSPIGVSEFFSEWGLKVLLSEFKYIVLSCLVLLIVRFLVVKLKDWYYNEF
ncbi:metal-dependent hydrolase [Sabulilitoribacter multivorans]|uniref:Metal-dependent hydrolase n=1 Tax=Flaviramulus multivorans TaxID=1304750 RepID=A0ABS9IET5_9FLAO|nr:metal-dependent hydrolase [Flaviramulus multivorans]MCF7559095.1 metal-dependent hydrolase [Flaviramulus multivorans]